VLNGSGSVDAGNTVFRQICQDILTSETSRVGSKSSQQKVEDMLNKLIDKHC